MPYTTPKTDWDENYEPSPQDMNRIEGNTKQNHDDIVSEASARATADSTLQANIDTLEEASLLTTTTLDFSGTASTFSSGTNEATTGALPRGLYAIAFGYKLSTSGGSFPVTTITYHYPQYYLNGDWRGEIVQAQAGIYYSDGTNFRISCGIGNNGSAGTVTTYYIKLA